MKLFAAFISSILKFTNNGALMVYVFNALNTYTISAPLFVNLRMLLMNAANNFI